MTTGTTTTNGRESLPETCPAWCSQGRKGHLQRLREGNSIEDACEQMSVDASGST